jgi:PelA/Pel-15E family pectate lyase
MNPRRLTGYLSIFALFCVSIGCGGTDDPNPNAGAGGTGAGLAGSAPVAGTSNPTSGAGTAGAAGTVGAAGGDVGAGGTTGTAGSAGATGASGGSGGSTTGTAGSSSTAGSGGSAGSVGTGPTLNQAGNPVYGLLGTYKSWLSTAAGDAAKLTADKTLADNMITWQLPHGGFYKNGVAAYAAPWNGSAARSGWTGAGGVELGTIDNNATVTEIMFLADVYRRSSDTKYREAARKALDFLLTMQYPTGGFPQVYPERPGTYSNYVTFNDDAMVRVMILLDQAIKQVAPLNMDVFSAAQQAKLAPALAKGLEYILAAQIVQGGTKTVWCAQHDPKTYAAMGARSYELPSKSGSESVGIVALLLSQPQSPAIKAAAQAAIAWYKKSGTANTAYVSRPGGNTDDTYNPIQTKSGSTMWHRFYDLDKDVGFFSGRLPTDDPPGTGKQYDIMKIEAERRYGYQWGGAYGTRLFTYTDTIGY